MARSSFDELQKAQLVSKKAAKVAMQVKPKPRASQAINIRVTSERKKEFAAACKKLNVTQSTVFDLMLDAFCEEVANSAPTGD